MRKETGIAVWVTAALVVVVALSPVLYVLSLGPAVRLVNAGLLNVQSAEVFYTPLQLLAEAWEPAEEALIAYVELWDPAMAVTAPANAPLPAMVPPPPPVQP